MAKASVKAVDTKAKALKTVKVKATKKATPSKPSKPSLPSKPSKPSTPAKPVKKTAKIAKNPHGAYTMNYGKEFLKECHDSAKTRGMPLSKMVIEAIKKFVTA